MLTVLHFSPKLSAAGVGALAADLAEELESGGKTQNIVMAPTGRSGSRVPYVSHPLGNMPLLGGMVLHGHLARIKVDIVVAYSEAAAWAAGRARRKLPPSKRPKLIGALTAFPHKHLLGSGWKYCDAFTAVSRHQRAEWEKFSHLFRRKAPHVIPYGMRETWCRPGYRPAQEWRDDWRERYVAAPEELTICVPAPITPLHGHEDLVPLLSTLRRNNVAARVFLAGDHTKAPSRYVERLKEIYRKAQLEHNIVWLGARRDLRDVLCACNITLCLDRRPASHNRPVQEALCLGRPVAGYDHGVVGELLGAFLPEGRVAPGQPEAMADTVTQWSYYRPTTVESIPSPYRLSDTVDGYMKLFETLRP